jgi:kinesin family protein 5
LLQENKSLSSQVNDLRLQVERLDYDNKEGVITIDILKEQNQDAKSELEELRMTIADLKTAQKDASAEDKEKRKQEKMAMMMAKFDTVSSYSMIGIKLIFSFYNSKGNSQRRMNNSERSFSN